LIQQKKEAIKEIARETP